MRYQERKKNRRKSNKTFEIIGLIVISLVVISFSNAYAKYVKRIEVDAPIDGFVAQYAMEVISDDGSDVRLSEKLELENINPGEFQVIPFVVRNAQKNEDGYIISDVDMIYDISIYHTQNLPLTYELYQYMGIDSQGDPIYELLVEYKTEDTNSENDYYNSGEIQIYTRDSKRNILELKSKTGEITQEKFRLVISWNNIGQISNDNNFVHEVDMAYLVVNGAQKE